MLVLLFYLLFIAPVRLTLTLDGGFSIGLTIWGLGRTWQPDMKPGPENRSPQQFMRMLGTVLRTDKARKFLLRSVRLVSLHALIRLGLSDAARTAAVTGALRQLTRLLPQQADVRIQPDFIHPTRIQARCILFFHLGTIIITAAMVLTAYLLEAREHPASQPKEA